MVATETAILPWSRQSLNGPPAPAAAKESARQALESEPAQTSSEGGFLPFGADGFSFLDLLDVINPLQHIPVVGTIYRELTGDTLDPLPRIAGSTLFFGPVGAAVSSANVVLEQASGQDLGDHIMALLRDEAPARETARSAPESKGSAVAEQSAADTLGAGDDPVSSWAREELAYREGLARQIAGADGPTRDAGGPGAGTLSWAEKPLALAEPVPDGARRPEGRNIPDVAPFLKALGADSPGETLAVLQEAGVAEPDRPRPAETSRRAVGAYGDAAGLAEPSRSGAVAPLGGWFSANVLNTLDRYQRGPAAGAN